MTFRSAKANHVQQLASARYTRNHTWRWCNIQQLLLGKKTETCEIAKWDTLLEDGEKERDMCELKRNVDPTYAVRPPMLNCPGSRNKEDAAAGQSRQIGSLPQSHRQVLLQSSSDSPGRRGITLGRCLCSAAIHQKMKGQPWLLNPQTRS